MSNEHIKNALWDAKREIRGQISDLEEVAKVTRLNLRYHQREVREYKKRLDSINRTKAILRRELKNADDIAYDLNPIKNIHKAKAKEATE